MNIIRLSELCEIFIGVNRFKTQNQLNDIDKSEYVYSYNLYRPSPNNSILISKENYNFEKCYFDKSIDEKNFLLKGDILMKLVMPFKFILIDGTIDMFLASSQYCIFRIKNKNLITPKQLWLYLNMYFEEEFKQYINKTLGIASIKTSDFKNKFINLDKVNDKKANLFYKSKFLDELHSNRKLLLEKIISNLCNRKE